MKRSFFFAVILLISISALAKNPEIEDISYFFEKQHIFVTFSLKEGFLNQDILEAIDSTNPVVFKYEIELARKKSFWIDKTVLRTVIEKTVQYDNLTRQYEITISQNGEVCEKKSMTSIEEVTKELSTIAEVNLGSTADLSPGENIYYLRAKATLFKGFFLLLFPNNVDTGWKEKSIKTP